MDSEDPDRRLRRREFLTAIGGSVLALGVGGLLTGCQNKSSGNGDPPDGGEAGDTGDGDDDDDGSGDGDDGDGSGDDGGGGGEEP
jgi:hypothetical protein